jgi:YD repeat-containing protein
VDVSTYDASGALLGDKMGVARTKSRFDARNLVQETALFDAHDKPTHDSRGASVRRFAYDDAGQKIGETVLDERGRVVRSAAASR